MNKVTVTFAGDNRNITIDFVHNVETESLDYNVKVEPPLNEGESMDLATILADKFLGSLIASVEDVEIVPDETTSNI